jgi:protein-ribulosamine 3-kinase
MTKGSCDEYLENRVRELFGSDARVVERHGLGGGCINNAEEYSLSGGDKLFVKRNRSSRGGLFAAEAAGLNALTVNDAPRVPRVLGHFDDGTDQILVLEFIVSAARARDFWQTFGRQMAALHRVSSKNGFGFDEDNHIGATEQKNSWMPSWLEFFAQQRIGFQLQLARDQGLLDAAGTARCERFIADLSDILIEPEAPSLLHGDLWGGNYMVGDAGEPVLIDPAVYYGHREADLAMTELFGGFDPSFHAAYNEVFPLDPGYRQRRDAYNLYHMLNHLNLFGGSYAGSVKAILQRYT